MTRVERLRSTLRMQDAVFAEFDGIEGRK